MKRFEKSKSPCPLGRASRLLGDRWTLLILREALLGATRFEEFLPNTGINRAALSSRLTILIESGLMERSPPVGRRAEYRLTAAGLEAAPILTEMRSWSEKWLFDDDGGNAPDYFQPGSN